MPHEQSISNKHNSWTVGLPPGEKKNRKKKKEEKKNRMKLMTSDLKNVQYS